MATLDLAAASNVQSQRYAEMAWKLLAIALTLPALKLVIDTAGGTSLFSGMPPAQAVTIFGIVGGASGAISQMVAANLLERADRTYHFVELVPAVVFSIALSVGATVALLPPNFTWPRRLLRRYASGGGS